MQAAEDFALFKSIMVQRNLHLNKQATNLLQRLNPAPKPSEPAATLQPSLPEGGEDKEWMVEEEEEEEGELKEAMRKSKEEYELRKSMEEEELQRMIAEATRESLKMQQEVNAARSPCESTQEREKEEQKSKETLSLTHPLPPVTNAPPTAQGESKERQLPSAPLPAHTSSSLSPKREVMSGAEAAANWLASARAEVSSDTQVDRTPVQNTTVSSHVHSAPRRYYCSGLIPAGTERFEGKGSLSPEAARSTACSQSSTTQEGTGPVHCWSSFSWITPRYSSCSLLN